MGVILLFCATGTLWVNATLDFELSQQYYLSVEGARGKPLLSDIATVIINITDVNDNPPVFNRSSYSAVIAEDISPGDTVLQVSQSVLINCHCTSNDNAFQTLTAGCSDLLITSCLISCTQHNELKSICIPWCHW